MENANFINVNLDLSTDLGKAVIVAIAGVLGGGAAVTSAATAPKIAKAAAPAAASATPTSGATTPAPKAAAPKADPAPAAAPKPAAAKPAPKAAAPKPAAPAAVEFADLDDAGKLEALKAHVTKHTKKGKSKDIRLLLTPYEVERAGDLKPEDYDGFNEVLQRYTDGESVTDIFPDLA